MFKCLVMFKVEYYLWIKNDPSCLDLNFPGGFKVLSNAWI